MVLAPLEPHLGDARHLLLAPDGVLNLLPFDALVDEGGRYLIERRSLTFLTSGRDLLRPLARTAAPAPPVVVADPDYDQAPGAESGAPGAGERAPRTRSADLQSLR
jgi:hypothetical protein